MRIPGIRSLLIVFLTTTGALAQGAPEPKAPSAPLPPPEIVQPPAALSPASVPAEPVEPAATAQPATAEPEPDEPQVASPLQWDAVEGTIHEALDQAAACLPPPEVPQGVKLRIRVVPDGRLQLIGSSPAIGPNALKCLKGTLRNYPVEPFDGPPLIMDVPMQLAATAAPPPQRFRRAQPLGPYRPSWLSERRPPLVAFELATGLSLGFCVDRGNAHCEYGKFGAGFDLAAMLRVLYFAAGLDILVTPLTAGENGSNWDTVNTYLGARLRTSYLIRRLEPFLDLHAGYAWFTSTNRYDQSVVSEGAYAGFSVGLQYRISRVLSVGGHFRFLTPWLTKQCTSPNGGCVNDGDFDGGQTLKIDGEHLIDIGFTGTFRFY